MCASPETGNAPRVQFYRINFADAVGEKLSNILIVRRPDLHHPSTLLFLVFMHLFDRWVTESACTRPRGFSCGEARLLGRFVLYV
jgi:hypothetical protein